MDVLRVASRLDTVALFPSGLSTQQARNGLRCKRLSIPQMGPWTGLHYSESEMSLKYASGGIV